MLLFFFPEQGSRINLSGASNYRNVVYDSDEEHTKKKRQRLALSKNNPSAAVDSYRQHVQSATVGSYRQHIQEANPASVAVELDETEINEIASV